MEHTDAVAVFMHDQVSQKTVIVIGVGEVADILACQNHVATSVRVFVNRGMLQRGSSLSIRSRQMDSTQHQSFGARIPVRLVVLEEHDSPTRDHGLLARRKPDRAYKDAGGEWKNTHSLKEADVPKAIAALNKAYLFMLEKEPDTED